MLKKKQRLMEAFLVLGVLFFPFFPAAAEEPDHRFLADYIQTVYAEESSIPITQANSVVQTRDGYVWIASYDGLFRYDGRKARLFGRVDGFPTSNVTELYEDAWGNLWIGTNDAGLVLYDGKKFAVYGTNEGLPSTSVRTITGDAAGNVYASTVFGLVSITPEREVRTIHWPSDRGNFAVNGLVSNDGLLWFVMGDGGVLVMDGSGYIHEHYAPRSLFGLEFAAIYQARDGAIYLGSRGNKVLRMQEGRFEQMEAGNCMMVNRFFEDSVGRLWICSDAGMGYFEGSCFSPVDGALVESTLENMAEGYEGDYWFASSRKGVLQVKRSKFRNLSFAWQLPELTVNATCIYDGNLYIGADEGLLIMDERGRTVENGLTRTLKGIRVRSLMPDDAGNLWIATYAKYGVIRYRADDAFTAITMDDGLAGNKVRCTALRETENGVQLLVGTGDGLSVVENDRVVRNHTREDGLSNPIVLSICIAPDGTIYLGTDGGGIYAIRGEELTNINEEDGLTSGIILRMLWDEKQEGMWVSMGNAVGFLGKDGFRHLDSLDERGASVFDFKIVGDDLWMLGSSGIVIVDRGRAASNVPGEFRVLDKRDGIASSITANSWNHMTPAGVLYIACNQGISSVDTQNLWSDESIPKLAINSATVDDKVYRNPDSLTLAAGARRLTVEFAMLSFAAPTGNVARAYLDGFDDEPVEFEVDQNNQVSYTNLKGGEYRFELSGTSRAQVEALPLMLEIHKEYGWLERTHTQVLLIALLAAGVGGIFAGMLRYKTKRLLARQQEYRTITEQAVMAIADTIDAKDKYTAGHSKRVADYSVEIAKRLGMPQFQIENLYYAALLHDIGKVGLEDSILNKGGTLTEEEYAKMKLHVRTGGDILKSITVIDNIVAGAKYHHEWYNGKGYLEKLSGESIPLFARIICVADSYDAMSTDRPYRESRSKEYILKELREGVGKQFDGDVIEKMIDIIDGGSAPLSTK